MDITTPATGKSAVDRLTTFFLGRFQETKTDNGLRELQCMTRLKFEATEKLLKEHDFSISTLRDEMRSFWDKAPSFFLHQFSAQLDALGSGRNEKNEQSMKRLEQRMDDEVKNLGEQLTSLSTKLAVGNAALNATVDDVGQKIRTVDDTHTSALRRSENEIRSKLARLESMLESSKTEADIERDKLNRTTQEADRKLLEKIESLELTLAMRQPEEHIIRQSESQLMLQEQATNRLEQDVKRLTQLVISQDKAASNMARVLAAQEQALQRAEILMAKQNYQPSISHPREFGPESEPSFVHKTRDFGANTMGKEWTASSPPSVSSTATPSSPPLGHVDVTTNSKANPVAIHNRRLEPSGALKSSTGQRKRQYDSKDREPLESLSQAHNRMEVQQPSSKRQRTWANDPEKITTQTLTSTSASRTDRTLDLPRREAGSRAKLLQPRAITAPENPKIPAENHVTASETTTGTQPQNMGTLQPVQYPVQPVSLGPDSVSKPIPTLAPVSAPPASSAQRKRITTQPRPQQRDRNSAAQQKPQSSSNKKRPAEDSTTAAQASDKSAEVKQNEHMATPEKPQNEKRRQETPRSLDSRESMRAFAMHVKHFAKQYNETPPRSERQFIWSFLEGIPDGRWSTYVQSKLLEKYPEAVRPSLGIRAKHTINFNEGLTWRHVVAMLRELTQKKAT